MSLEIIQTNILVVGDANSGKSSVIWSLTNDKFKEDLPKVLKTQSLSFTNETIFNFIDSDCKFNFSLNYSFSIA